MIIGYDNIMLDDKCGIAETHFKAIAEVSQKSKVVIGIRPVSTLAKYWIEKGYPSKSFDIKNKTGRTGPCQGLIAVDFTMGRTSASPSPSVTPNSSQDEYDVPQSYEEMMKKSYDCALEKAVSSSNNTLQKIPLVLSKEDLNALKKVTIEPKEFTEFAKLTWDDDLGVKRYALALIDSTNKYSIVDENNEPIMVLGKQITNALKEVEVLPVTADYDLLVVCPSFKDFAPGSGQKDHTPLRTQTLNKTLRQYGSPIENDKGGNWSKRIEELVKQINCAIALPYPDSNMINNRCSDSQGLEMLHHNAEFSNPFASDLLSSLPAIIFFPKKMNFSTLPGFENTPDDDCVLVETPEELNQLRDYLKHKEYYWPANMKFNEQIPVFPKETIDIINNLMMKKKLLQDIQDIQENKLKPDNNVKP